MSLKGNLKNRHAWLRASIDLLGLAYLATE